MKKGTVEFHSQGPTGNIYYIIGAAQTIMRKQRRIDEYNKMQEIKSRMQESRYREVQGSNFSTIREFDEQKVYSFIRGVRIKNWTVTFEFYNGVEISRTYTNGKPGNIRDWKIKQMQRRREQENG